MLFLIYPVNVLNSDLWYDKICNSNYFEHVFCGLIPAMTSATTPSGEVISNGYQSGYSNEPWTVFSGIPNSKWAGSMTTGLTEWYIGYKFPTDKKVCVIMLTNGIYNDTNFFTKPSIQVSNNGVDWDTVVTANMPAQKGYVLYISLPKNTKYKFFRIYESSDTLVDHTPMCSNIQFYGRS